MELRQHATAAVVLPVGAAVLDPGVLVLALEHLVHREVAREALAVRRLLPGDERLAALVGIDPRGQVEALRVDVADERVLEADLVLGDGLVVLAHEEPVLALGVARVHGEAQIDVAAEDLFHADDLAEVVVGGDHFGELARDELVLELVAQLFGVGRQPLGDFEQFVCPGRVQPRLRSFWL